MTNDHPDNASAVMTQPTGVVMGIGRDLGFLLLMFLAVSFVAARLLNLAGSTNLIIPAILGVAGAAGLWLWVQGRQAGKPLRASPAKAIGAVLLWLGLFVPVVILLKILPDFSYDAKSYHIPGIMAYLDGWNPYAGPPDAKFWVQIYPNGMWQIQAMIERITAIPGMGRITGPILFFVAFFALYDLVRLRYGRVGWLLLMGMLLVVCNPYSIMQWHVNYIDGEYINLAIIFGCALSICLIKPSRRAGLMLGAALLLAVNTKVSAVYILFFITASLLLGMAAPRLIAMLRGKAWSRLRKSHELLLPVGVVAGLLVSTMLFGYRPYVTNAMDFGTPFYHGDQDFTAFSPPNMVGASQTKYLTHLVFGRVNRVRQYDSVLKIPGTFKGDDFHNHETAQGGFGANFGILLVLSLLLAGFGIRDSIKRRKADPFLLMGLAALVATLCFPYPIQGRFVPWMWMVPGMLFLSSAPGAGFRIRSVRSVLAVTMQLYFCIHLALLLISLLVVLPQPLRGEKKLLALLRAQDSIWRVETPFIYGPDLAWQRHLARKGITFAPEYLPNDCNGHEPLNLSGKNTLPVFCLSPGGAKEDGPD